MREMDRVRYEPLSWHAPEHTYYEKTPDWYWGFGLVVAALLFISYLAQSVLSGFLVVIAGAGVLLFAIRKPRTITIALTGHGVEVNDRLFPYDTLQSFWIFYRPGHRQELILKSSRGMERTVRIQLGDADPVDVREYLLQYLPEHAEEESLTDVVSRLLKF